MLTSRRTTSIAATGSAVMLLVGLFGSTASVLATGTCPGQKQEYVIPAEQQNHDPLLAYDLNGDWIICVAAKGRKTAYSDNRP
jgi:hypothetical protein